MEDMEGQGRGGEGMKSWLRECMQYLPNCPTMFPSRWLSDGTKHGFTNCGCRQIDVQISGWISSVALRSKPAASRATSHAEPLSRTSSAYNRKLSSDDPRCSASFLTTSICFNLCCRFVSNSLNSSFFCLRIRATSSSALLHIAVSICDISSFKAAASFSRSLISFLHLGISAEIARLREEIVERSSSSTSLTSAQLVECCP